MPPSSRRGAGGQRARTEDLQAQAGRRETTSRVAARPREVARERPPASPPQGLAEQTLDRSPRGRRHAGSEQHAAATIDLDARDLDVEVEPARGVSLVARIVLGAGIRAVPRPRARGTMRMDVHRSDRGMRVRRHLAFAEPDAEGLTPHERGSRLHEEQEQRQESEERSSHGVEGFGLHAAIAEAIVRGRPPTISTARPG